MSSQRLQRLQALRTDGHRAIDQAVALEQQAQAKGQPLPPADASRAIALYYQGVAALEEARALPLSDVERRTAEPLLLKMRQTADKARERAQLLAAPSAPNMEEDPPPAYTEAPAATTASTAGYKAGTTATTKPSAPAVSPTAAPIAAPKPVAAPKPPTAAPKPPTPTQTNLLGALSSLWLEALTDTGTVNSAGERQQQVRSHQQRADAAMGSINAVDAGGQPGLPTSIGGYLDLLTEACGPPTALLPRMSLPAGTARPPARPTPAPSQPALSANTIRRGASQLAWAHETLAREPEQRWLRINWARDAKAAAELASRTGKPMFVELVVGRYGRNNSAMRASALSDDRVIAAINQSFVPVEINVTKDGFPTEHIPALAYAENAYKTNWRCEFGFASCIAVDDTGKVPLALATSMGRPTEVYSQKQHGDNFLAVIQEALSRHAQVRDVRRALYSLDFLGAGQKIAALTMEVITSFQTQAAEAIRQRTELDMAPGEFADLARAQNQMN